jgi:hypothetical protein
MSSPAMQVVQYSNSGFHLKPCFEEAKFYWNTYCVYLYNIRDFIALHGQVTVNLKTALDNEFPKLKVICIQGKTEPQY